MPAGCDSVRVDPDAERQGKRKLAAFIEIRPLVGRGLELKQGQGSAKVKIISFAFERNVAQECFLFMDILYQAGKVKAYGVALFFDHALYPHIADAQQQQHQRAEHYQAFIAAQGAAGQFLQQGIGVTH